MELKLSCNGQQIDSKWVADSLAAVGVSKFMDLNPWAREIVKIPKSKKKPLTDEQRHLKEVMAHHWRELGLDLRSKGWSVKDVARLGVSQKKISRREAADRKKVEVTGVQSSPRSTHLDHMFKYPRRQSQGIQYDRKSRGVQYDKKKAVA